VQHRTEYLVSILYLYELLHVEGDEEEASLTINVLSSIRR